MLDRFSFRRLWLVVRKDLFELKSFYINQILGGGVLLAFVCVIMTFSYNVDIDGFSSLRHEVYSTLLTAYRWYMFFLVAVCASYVNRRNSRVEWRLQWLMLPATAFEKYLSLLLKSFLVIPLLGFCAIAVSELLRVLFFLVFARSAEVVFISPFSPVFGSGYCSVNYVLGVAMVLSFFFFCSFLFKRPSFAKALLVGFCLFVLFTIATSAAFVYFHGMMYDVAYGASTNYEFIDGAVRVLNAYSLTIMPAATLFFIVWPYWRLKESEL